MKTFFQVCFIHKYATESGVEQYDFGCTLPEVSVVLSKNIEICYDCQWDNKPSKTN